MKAIQTNNQGGKFSSKFHFRNNNYIKYSRNLNKTGLLSAFTFLLLALTCLFPISKGEQNTEAVTGTVQSSSLTLNVAKSAASVELDVNSMAGTFASSNPDNSAIFTVTTNNFSGYTLSISGNDDEGKLYDQTKQNFLSSLSSATTETDFSAINKTDLNGKWGYKPSKFNSNVNEDYLPAPTTEASTIDTTATANATANNYSISLGIRADYTTLADTYTNTFTIIAVPNPIAYVITYDANTTDTVSNMPAAQNSTTSATSITLSDKTPTRENYDFKGWCTVAPTTSNPDTCAGTAFQPGDTYGIDQTSENITTLYAMWKQGGIAITYDANGGYFGNNTSKTTNVVVYDPNSTKKITKISKSPNVDDDGNSTGDYADSLAVTDVITIPGATELHVTITYQTEGISYDWVAIYDGSVVPSASNYAYSITGKLVGGANGGSGGSGGINRAVPPSSENSELKTEIFTIPGDTAQFFFRTDVSNGSYYGYYATIEGEGIGVLSGEELTPIKDGYAFDGWYTDTAGTAGNEFKITTEMNSQTVYAKWVKNLNIIFEGNGSTGGATSPQTVAYKNNVSLNPNGFTKEGHIFTGWNTKPNGSGTSYKDGAIYGYTSIVNDYTLILYAQWEKLSMQKYTTSQCSTEAVTQAVTLPDLRDGKTYTVRYINGKCWMTQNLKIDAGQVMTRADTNIISDYTMPSNDLTSGDSYTEARMHTGDNANIGNWYNYCAATAGTICEESSSSVALYDICPKGWKLPSRTDLKKLTPNSDGWDATYLEAFTPAIANYYSGGSLDNSEDAGNWWASTPVRAGSAIARGALDYRPRLGGLYSGISLLPTAGLSVRCVLK